MRTTMQNEALDYKRFNSDSLLDCYKLEYDALKAVCPDVPITTNLMGTYRELDYHKWGKHLDFVSFDNYPRPETPYTRTAMNHALMRGLKDGLPFCLMEQTPSVTNWAPYCSLKRPGIMRLWSYQALAHGADSVLFFQMRRSRGCCEKFHGAVIDHAGHENTRVFRECAELGAELQKLGGAFIDSRVNAEVAVIFDWDTWWATAYSAGPTADLDYVAEVFRFYDAASRQNFGVDVIGMDGDFSRYKLIIAPVFYMVKPGVASRLKDFVRGGGAFVTTFFSGYVDERDLITTGGYPGELRELCGLWVEEIDALLPGHENAFVIRADSPACSALAGTYPATLLCDIMHAESAEVIATYQSDFYAGTPAICRNEYGSGEVWYIGARADGSLLRPLLGEIAAKRGIEALAVADEGIEITKRVADGKTFLVALNHNTADAAITVPHECTELLSGRHFTKDERYTMKAAEVCVFSF
jgi:beta-galactosidase